MDYDTHGSGASTQEDLWLDDLKSLLDDQPGTYGRSQVPSGGKPGNSYVQQGRVPQPSYAGYAQSQGQGRNQNYGQTWGGVQNQARGQASAPAYAYAQPVPPRVQAASRQDYNRTPVKPQKPERKKSVYGSIITLSIIVALEAAAIAALAIHWIQWMA